MTPGPPKYRSNRHLQEGTTNLGTTNLNQALTRRHNESGHNEPERLPYFVGVAGVPKRGMSPDVDALALFFRQRRHDKTRKKKEKKNETHTHTEKTTSSATCSLIFCSYNNVDVSYQHICIYHLHAVLCCLSTADLAGVVCSCFVLFSFFLLFMFSYSSHF